MRPDHLSCYGYHRQTSPNIDNLAAEGILFRNFYATDTPCLPSRTAGGLENADKMYPPAQQWLQTNGKKDNWFFHLNFCDPHIPYDHPASYGNPFQNEPINNWIIADLIKQKNQSFDPHSVTEVPGYI